MSLEAVQLKQAGSRQQLLGGEKLVSLERGGERGQTELTISSLNSLSASFNGSVLTKEQKGHEHKLPSPASVLPFVTMTDKT